MRTVLLFFIAAVLLVCSTGALAQTVGTEITAEEITDFYYTYSWIGYNAFYQRYHFYVQDGKHLFFHETRETKNDYGWNTEDDVTATGTKELTDAEWTAFFHLISGGTVSSRSTEPVDGDSGPWMYLYRTGDASGDQQYAFPSPEAQAAFEQFCEALAAEPLNDAVLLSCTYSITGGMENEDTVYTVTRDETGREKLTVEEHGKTEIYSLPGGTLDDLAGFMAGYHPEKWSALPDAEEYALDAPDRRIVLRYQDGTEYAVFDNQQTTAPLFRDTDRFLRSYLAQDTQTYELVLSSFGGGPEYRAVLSAPEAVRIEWITRYDGPSEVIPPGSELTVTLIFHGRVPGRTEVAIEACGPLAPPENVPLAEFVLEVDEAYNVMPVEKSP